MSEKPSYLGLLNAISVAETEAECYLNAWAEATNDDGVRQVIATVALREGEHGKAFAKRICELGYSVLARDNSQAAAKLAIASSPDLTDREKFEKLDLSSTQDSSSSKDDVFTRMFADKNIDIQTGALLGRYIAEERDSGRMLRACYNELCRRENGNGHSSGGVDASVAESLSRIECLLEQLVARQG